MNKGDKQIQVSAVQGLPPLRVKQSRPYDNKRFHVTLNQWRALHAVVDCGSFGSAAEQLKITQSSISYSVAKLEEQLGINVFQIRKRRAELTKAGRLLVNKSRGVLREALELDAIAQSTGHKTTSTARFAIDPVFPADLLADAILQLQKSGQDIGIEVTEMKSRKIRECLQQRRAEVGVTAIPVQGMECPPLLCIEYVPVISAGHRFAGRSLPLHISDLHGEVEVAIHLEAGEAGSTCYGEQPLHTRRWTVSNVDTAIRILCCGLGYAWLPRHVARSWLDQGKLQTLSVIDMAPRRHMLYLCKGEHVKMTAGLRSLMNKLSEVCCSAAMETPQSHCFADFRLTTI
jgi:DNA-binding transcriptional LysR family regulator